MLVTSPEQHQGGDHAFLLKRKAHAKIVNTDDVMFVLGSVLLGSSIQDSSRDNHHHTI